MSQVQVPAANFVLADKHARDLLKSLRAKEATGDSTREKYSQAIRRVTEMVDVRLRRTLEQIGKINLDSLGEVPIAADSSEIRYDPALGVTIHFSQLTIGDKTYTPRTRREVPIEMPDVIPTLLAEPRFTRFVQTHRVREIITPDGRAYDVQGVGLA